VASSEAGALSLAALAFKSIGRCGFVIGGLQRASGFEDG
jgi:hypothetical protein